MKKIYCIFIFSVIYKIGIAQSVAINNIAVAAHSSAILDINSITKGLLIPRVALTDRSLATPITLPAVSLLVYNTASAGSGINVVRPGYYYWTGSSWNSLTPANTSWLLNGNSNYTTPVFPASYGTTLIGAAENWLGATGADDIVLGTNNIERMRIMQTNGRVAIGIASPISKLHVEDSSSAANVIFAESNFIGSANKSAITGTSINSPGFGIGGSFTGGNVGVQATGNGGAGSGTAYGILSTATGTTGTKIGGFFSAAGVGSNYAIITPSNGGNIGFGTISPADARLEVEGVVGKTVALFRGFSTGKGLSLTSDDPGVYFNSYYDGVGVKSMSGNAVLPNYSGSIQFSPDSGYISFHTTRTKNTAANSVVALKNRMRITDSGQVCIGVDNTGKLDPEGDLTVLNPEFNDVDVPIFTARKSGIAGTTWRMGSIEYYTEGAGNIGFTHQICPLDGNGNANLGSSAGTRYFGYRWGTLFTTTGVNISSDITLKEKISPVVYGIHQLRKINPISYVLKDQRLGDGSKVADNEKRMQLGFSAQELKEVLPEVVSSWNYITNKEKGYIKALDPTLGVYYSEIIPVTINAIKQLDEQQQKMGATINLSDFGTEVINGTELTVNFTDAFKTKLQGNPVVTITALNPNTQFYVSKVDNNGFTVISSTAVTNHSFNWIAMAKIKTANLEIQTTYTEDMHQKKLEERKAFEATLPNNEEVLKIIKQNEKKN
jgi:hypothetical protein